jgi:hypothetical protein
MLSLNQPASSAGCLKSPDSVVHNRAIAKSFHEKAGRSQDGFVLLSVDPNLFTEPPLSPSFHPQSVMSDDRSLPVGRPRYSRC